MCGNIAFFLVGLFCILDKADKDQEGGKFKINGLLLF